MQEIKKALVTGGAGFIGTNLIKRLLTDGYQVVSIDNYFTGKKDNHQDGCTYIDGDIKEVESLLAWHYNLGTNWKPDIVYHLAAFARIHPSFETPDICFDVNCIGTFNIVYYCTKNKIPIVYAGTSAHHAGKYENPYAFTKDVGEDILEMFQHLYGLKANIARFYNVYGPHHLKEGAYCTVIGIWENAIENGMPLLITGDGSKRRDFIHVNDIVDAMIKMYEKDSWGHIFELGTGMNISIADLANMFNYSKIEYIPNRPGEAQDTLCTDSKAKEILAWEAKFKLQDYINEYVESRKILN